MLASIHGSRDGVNVGVSNDRSWTESYSCRWRAVPMSMAVVINPSRQYHDTQDILEASVAPVLCRLQAVA